MTETNPSARRLWRVLADLGASHVVGLPDNGTAALFATIASDERAALLTVTREGEAFAIAAGLWLGGQCPVVVIQNTGLLESGDGLRGTATRMGAPLVSLISVRGHAKMRAHAARLQPDPESGLLEPAALRSADIDSVAPMTEPTLRAWGIPQWSYAHDGDAAQVVAAWEDSRRNSRPVAVLLPHALG